MGKEKRKKRERESEKGRREEARSRCVEQVPHSSRLPLCDPGVWGLQRLTGKNWSWLSMSRRLELKAPVLVRGEGWSWMLCERKKLELIFENRS